MTGLGGHNSTNGMHISRNSQKTRMVLFSALGTLLPHSSPDTYIPMPQPRTWLSLPKWILLPPLPTPLTWNIFENRCCGFYPPPYPHASVPALSRSSINMGDLMKGSLTFGLKFLIIPYPGFGSASLGCLTPAVWPASLDLGLSTDHSLSHCGGLSEGQGVPCTTLCPLQRFLSSLP